MVRRFAFIQFILTVGLFTMVIEQSAHAQGAKIQRKTASLQVYPQLLVQGEEIHAVVQSFDDRPLLRLSLTRPDGEVLEQMQLTGDSPLLEASFLIPQGMKGTLRVVLEARYGLHWTPAASQEVSVLPGYWSELRSLVSRVEAVEAKSDAHLQRAAWAVLAFAEDLMERMKLGESNQAWDVQRRLAALRSKTELLEQGKDPLANSPGYQLRGYRSDLNGEIQLYSMYLPRGYGVDPEQKWPLVVMLHGAWSNHHLALRRVMGFTNNPGESDAAAKRSMPRLPDVPFIVVAPNGFETSWYAGYAEEDVWRVMEEIKSQFNIDSNRVYLTGLSMGGMGTGKLGLNHPDQFAAIAPVCGFFGGPFRGGDAKKPAYLERLIECSAALEMAENALYLPTKIMHGEIDPVVPVQQSINLNKKLNELGYQTEIEVYPGVDHAAWAPAYENGRIFEWFSQFERNPAPAKVIYKTGDPQGGASYWVRIEEPLKIRRMARIEAQISDRSVAVKTENLQRFSMTIPESLIPAEDVAQVEIDGNVIYQGTPGREIRFVYENDAWKWSRDAAAKKFMPPRDGLFGVLSTKHVLVYGTSGVSAEDRAAQELANAVSLPGPWVDVQFPVMPEDGLTPDVLENYHIVLFATLGGSSFLRNHLPSLPIHVEGDRIEIAGRTVQPDQAIAFICPNPANSNKCLMVCASATLQGLQAFRNASAIVGSVGSSSSGDFVVLDANGKPLWGGLFDKEWKIDETGDFE
ncbi:MAG: prolyl oligopeptidase family serine peptidase [Candidatus Omnitrophica bacterium]|nr:prolyl oligopeptidase family serine peptidase [Candidatus Omnitrophota bacterium]